MDLKIREALPTDAERMIAYTQRLSNEPGVDIGLSPGEFTITPEEERVIIQEYAAAENAIFMLAEVGDQIVGLVNCKGSKRLAFRHGVTLGISVAKGWRKQGVGAALMARAIEWARETGVVRRIELDVFARNTAATALYRKFGFQVEGRRRQAVFRDGQYLDNLIMALLL
jgi:putative acetyltransferase